MQVVFDNWIMDYCLGKLACKALFPPGISLSLATKSLVIIALFVPSRHVGSICSTCSRHLFLLREPKNNLQFDQGFYLNLICVKMFFFRFAMQTVRPVVEKNERAIWRKPKQCLQFKYRVLHLLASPAIIQIYDTARIFFELRQWGDSLCGRCPRP